jgi:hypothetical protein
LQASNLRFALTEQPGYEKNGTGGKPAENLRNGKPSKTLRTDEGGMEIAAPCGREGGGAENPAGVRAGLANKSSTEKL